MAAKRSAAKQSPSEAIPFEPREVWEDKRFFPATVPLDWLQQARQRHLDAIDKLALAVHNVGAIEDAAEASEQSYRHAVRDAVAAEREAPAREVDPATFQARREVGEEACVAQRDALAEVFVRALGECRERWEELEAHAGELGRPLLTALTTGPTAWLAMRRSRLRRRLHEIEHPPEPAIETIGEHYTMESEQEVPA
jgi:hypothetical protein